MSKRKTRQQKIISDLRRKITETSSSHTQSKSDAASHVVHTPSYTYQANQRGSVPESRSQTHPVSYAYVLSDVSKTAFLTGGLVVLQFILFFLLKTHLLNFSGLNY